jgi:RNA polymerase sigma-70 factor (ECF subfamily)
VTALTPPAPILTKQEVQALAARAAQHDLAAFDALYVRYGTAIRNVVASYFPDSGDVDDLTQDAFLKAWLALITGRYDARNAFAAWLYRIAINVCKDELRHRALVHFDRLDGVLSSPMTPQRAECFVSTDPLDDPAWVADRAASVAITSEVVREAMARITAPKERQALTLREFGGLSYGEIAEVLETTHPAVKALIWRARESLRAMPLREALV